jgi:hydroxymethylglutaryl-CoA lyase
VPNIEGYEKLKNFNFDENSIVISASNTHNQRNINRNIKESIAYYHELANFAKSDRKPFRAYISCSFGCPYEGKIAVSSVVELSRRIMDMGAYELSISDTIGVANPTSIEMLLEELFKYIPPDKIALHLHNTRNLALTNIYTASKLGITSFDASFGGLGGCPYAHGASGNIATEDLVAMLYALGIKTSINLDKLCEVSRCVKEILKKQLSSKIFSIYQK